MSSESVLAEPSPRAERSAPGGQPPGAVHLREVTKVYDLGASGVRIRDAVPGLRLRPTRPLVAVDAVDLDIAAGEAIGIIGPNGAGKSTLLKLIAGVTRPTSGTIAVGGKIGSMVELGLGFHPELTGWENIACSGIVLGLDRPAIDDLTPSIAAFSGIEDALDHPLVTYSTGMCARLGFAVATHVGADLLVIDEVLAVGDAAFQLRCFDRIAELSEAGTTIAFVSHDMSVVTGVCSRVVHLSEGRIVDDGAADDVVERYLARSPSGFRRSDVRALWFERCGLANDEIESWQPIEIEAEVHVAEPPRAAQVAVDYWRRVEADEGPVSSVVHDVPELTEPGRYLLRGATSPFPGAGGSVNVITTLVDSYQRTVADRAVHVLRVAGPVRPGNMQLATTPRFAIEPIAPTGPTAGADGFGRGLLASGGKVVARLSGVTKRFATGGRGTRARLLIPGDLGHRERGEVRALDGVDLEIEAGTALGVIGSNGAGKSTLLRALAGITTPDAGTVETYGRVVPVLDLGLGFHPDLTGARNLITSARLLGMTGDEAAAAYDAIVDYAGLGEMMDVPVKRYSTGMRARLGFALALHASADVLLLDELLAVGDESFRRKAIDAVQGLQEDGVTVVFVSHELLLVEQLCNRAVRLEAGRVVDDGDAAAVVARYGGSSWVAGAADASSGIRLHELRLHRHRIALDGSFEFEGVLEVDEASPNARLEVSYRAAPDDRRVVLDADEIRRRTFLLATLEPAGGALSRAGWYRFTGGVDRNAVAGSFDIVLAVVDERHERVLSEVWQSVTVGAQDHDGRPAAIFTIDWQVERLGDLDEDTAIVDRGGT